MHRFEKLFGKWVVKYRWLLIVLCLATITISASGMRFLSFNSDDRVFFSDENPQLKALEELENTYSKNNNVFFVIKGTNGTVFENKTLKLIEELTEESWKIPNSSRVDSLSNYQHTTVEGDDLLVENLYENAGNLSKEDLINIEKIALNEPMLVSRIVSKTGHVAGININIIAPSGAPEAIPETAKYSRKLFEKYQKKYPNIEMYLTGGVIWGNGFAEVSKDDMATLTPLMLLVLVILIGFCFRSISGTVSTLIIILSSMFTGMGLAGWFGIELTAPSVNAATIILTLAVADSVHILSTIFLLMRKGMSKHNAISESLRINLQAVFLTSITTAVGFLTMNFSDAPPFRDQGNIVAMGVIAAFVYSVLLLPAFIAVIPVKVKNREQKEKKLSMNWLADFVVNRKNIVFWGSIITFIILCLGMLKIELNDQWIKYFDKKYDFRVASDFVEENLSGIDVIEYSLESGETGGINDPAYLNTVENFANWYKKQPKVVHVNTVTDIVKRLNKNMNNDDPEFYRIPENRELAAQYLLLYEMSVPFGLDLNNQINVSKSATRMIVTMNNTSTRELREMDENARRWLKENAPEKMYTYGSGLSVIWSHISERNINGMLKAAFLALILISMVLIVALRDLKIGLISLIPNLSPAIMAFGIWGFIDGQVGLGLSIIVSLTLGIVVDDTVHFLSKYLRARREQNMNAGQAVHYSFNTVGTAMVITTFVLVVGFLVLTLSGFKMNSDTGLMTAITITVALVMDFMLLPVILLKIDKPKNKNIEKDENKMKLINKNKNKKELIAKIFMLIFVTCFALPSFAVEQSPEQKGLEISKEADRRDTGFIDSKSNMEMVLRNKQGQESVRKIRSKTLEVVGDGDKSMTIFDNPRDVKGTAFLNFTHKKGDDDQWLYLPALKRVKRISSRNKSGSFMGSEFSYEDISSREIEKYVYKWVKDETYQGQDCFVVEAYPIDKKNSGYSKQVSWIDKKEYRTLKVDFYDRKNSHLKTLTFNKYKQYKGKFWRSGQLDMVNHQNGKSTTLKFTNYKFGIGLKSRDFSKNSLKRAR